jgi:chitodextrinase
VVIEGVVVVGPSQLSIPRARRALVRALLGVAVVAGLVSAAPGQGFAAAVTVTAAAPAITASTARPEVSTDARFRVRTPGTVSSVAWTFGDGGTATGATATHRWTALGTFTVRAKVRYADGSSAAAKPVTVTVLPHTVTVVCDRTRFEVGERIGCGLRVSGGDIRGVHMTWGDGSGSDSTSHHWDRPGTYGVTAKVFFGDGTQATTAAPTYVTVTPLTVTITASTLRPAAGENVTFGIRLSTGSVAAVQWGFGDGTGGSGATAAHHWTAAGTYHVTARVTLANNALEQPEGTRADATPVTVTVSARA